MGKSFRIIAILCSLLSFVACEKNAPSMVQHEEDTTHTCILVWDGEIESFGNQTRAKREKQDGDCVRLRFLTSRGYVNGKAVYNKPLDEWLLTYHGTLSDGTASSCQVYYFEEQTDAYVIPLDYGKCVRRDLNAKYAKEGNRVKLSARLKPATGRIRFTGKAGSTFRLAGIACHTSFDGNSFELDTDQTPLELTVGSNGFTPYVHATLLSNRQLTISYNYETYTITCQSPVLDAGRTGYMHLPTEQSHSGWQFVKMTKATLSSVAIDGISHQSATAQASVTSLGNGHLSDAGFVYATSPNPTIESYKHSCGTNTNLSAHLANLEAETTYYIRAYASNEIGVNYGPETTFTTDKAPILPKVTTGSASNITTRSATLSGRLTDMGNSSRITQHGHVWATHARPTVDDNKTTLGSLTNISEFRSDLTMLSPFTTYYVRSYAENEIGIAYGDAVSFTTEKSVVLLETTAVSNLNYNKATASGKVLDLDGSTISEIGFCWGTNASPNISDNSAVADYATSALSLDITGLTEKTQYFIRIYVKTDTGDYYYGNVLSFTTPSKAIDVGADGFGDDEDWTPFEGGATISTNDFPEDEDWTPLQGGSTITTSGFSEDEDWSMQQ